MNKKTVLLAVLLPLFGICVFAAGQIESNTPSNGGTGGVSAEEANAAALTWTLATQNEISQVESVAYGNGKFVVVMRVGGFKEGWRRGDPLPASKLMYSTDGINWTVKDNPLGSAAITFCGGKFFLVGDNSAFSTDGENWTRFDLKIERGDILAPVYGNGKYVCATNLGQIFYSSDGVTWTATRIPIDLKALVYGNGKFIAMDDGGKMAYSTDGVTWTVAPGTHGNVVRSIAYGAGRFVKIGWDHTSYSEDGLTWTFIDFFGFSGSTGSKIIYGGGKFIAIDYEGRMAYSTDGITWEMVDISVFDSTRVVDIAYGSGRFVALDHTNDGGTGRAPTNRGKIAYSNLQE